MPPSPNKPVSISEAMNTIQGLMLELLVQKQNQDNNSAVKEARGLVDRYIAQRYEELDALYHRGDDRMKGPS